MTDGGCPQINPVAIAFYVMVFEAARKDLFGLLQSEQQPTL